MYYIYTISLTAVHNVCTCFHFANYATILKPNRNYKRYLWDRFQYKWVWENTCELQIWINADKLLQIIAANTSPIDEDEWKKDVLFLWYYFDNFG